MQNNSYYLLLKHSESELPSSSELYHKLDEIYSDSLNEIKNKFINDDFYSHDFEKNLEPYLLNIAKLNFFSCQSKFSIKENENEISPKNELEIYSNFFCYLYTKIKSIIIDDKKSNTLSNILSSYVKNFYKDEIDKANNYTNEYKEKKAKFIKFNKIFQNKFLINFDEANKEKIFINEFALVNKLLDFKVDHLMQFQSILNYSWKNKKLNKIDKNLEYLKFYYEKLYQNDIEPMITKANENIMNALFPNSPFNDKIYNGNILQTPVFKKNSLYKYSNFMYTSAFFYLIEKIYNEEPSYFSKFKVNDYSISLINFSFNYYVEKEGISVNKEAVKNFLNLFRIKK